MKLADSHTHLYLEEFDNDRDEMIGRALDQQVSALFMPNIDSGSIGPMLEVSSRYPDVCYPMMGLHPTSVAANWKDELAVVEKELARGGYVAVGEIGIDLYWDKTFRKEQEEAFKIQIGLARQHDLPVVIHSRNSFDEIFAVMDEVYTPGLRGVFHCFTGGRRHVERILEWGFKLGIGGVLTFKNAGLDRVIEGVPLEHILLETDSPYLSPVPHRGKRNESAYIRLIADRLAEIKGISTEEVAGVTTHNTMKLFGLENR